MSKTAEQKILVSVPEGVKNLRTNIVNGGTAVEIIYEAILQVDNETATSTAKKKVAFSISEEFEKMFLVVKASTLSLEDEFLKHRPESDNQIRDKKLIIKAIKSELTDFRAPAIDPSFDENGKICYKVGMEPAVGKSANWWYENSKNFMPSKNSRMGTDNQRYAWLALLIKWLIEEAGYTIGAAWKAVCDDSTELGHYWNSKDAKHDFETTGSRPIGEWYDLANTCKITKKASGFSLFGGFYCYFGVDCPLSDAYSIDDPCNDCYNNVGWLVLDV